MAKAATRRRRSNPLRVDPTRTGSIRRRFLREVRRRFTWLRRRIHQLVAVEDCFGLRRDSPGATLTFPTGLGASRLIGNTRFAFLTDDRKVAAFQEWLQDQIAAGVLSTEGDATPGEPWTAEFVLSAYRQGVARAYAESRAAAAVDDDDFYRGGQEQFLADAFTAGQSVARMRMLATRSYEDLRGITTAMSTQIGRELAQGFAEGRGAMDMARRLTDRVEKIGRTRAETLARSEVVRAYNEAALDSYERLGVEEIGIMVEFAHAGDGSVCERCAPLQGIVLKVKEARGLLPVHPNCRCTFLPSNIGEPTKGQKRTKRDIEEAIDESVQAEFPNRPLEEAKERTTWAGADKTIDRSRKVKVDGKRQPDEPDDDEDDVEVVTETSSTTSTTQEAVTTTTTTTTTTTSSTTTTTPRQFSLLDEKRAELDKKQERFDELVRLFTLSPDERAELNRLRQELKDLDKEIRPLLRAKIEDVIRNDKELEAIRQRVIDAQRGGSAEEHAKREKELKDRLRASAKESDKLEKEIRKNWNKPKIKAKLDAQYAEVKARHDANMLAYQTHIRNKTGVIDARKAVAYDGPTAKISGANKDKMPAGMRKSVEEGEAFINGLVPADRLKDRSIVYDVKPTGRAYYSHGKYSDSGKNEIAIEHNVGIPTVAHEIGHHFEYHAADVRKAAQEFLEKRIEEGGKPNVNLEQKFGIGFRASETGNEDKFGAAFGEGSVEAHYVGKIVGSENSTEIISMGVEQMYRDPAGFAEKDPEYFKFILGVLRGKI